MNGPVLVTGGAGYIGGHAVLCLKDHGRDAVVLDNLSTRNLQSVPDNVTFVEGDVGDQALVQRVISEHRCTAVLHFAGSIVVSESVDAPLTYYQNNVAAGIALIQACVEEGVKQIIFSSTAAVYGANAGANTTEDTETMSLSPYGRSKQMMEDIIKDAANAHGLQFAILRYFNVAGADPALRNGPTLENATHLFAAAIRSALGSKENNGNIMDVFGENYDTPDGTCIRDFIHVSDLVDIHRIALNYLETGGENVTLNCGYGKGYSVREVIDIVSDVTQVSVRTRSAPRRPGDIVSAVADTARLQQTLPWQPRHDIRSIAETVVAWQRQAEADRRP
jgi:UDP-glucose 4-epimerase